MIRYRYPLHPALLPSWVDEASLLAQLIQALADNHVYDIADWIAFNPWVLPLRCWALPLDSRPGGYSVDLLVDGNPTVVPLASGPFGLYESPDPVALYAAETLLVFNLHQAYSSGQTIRTSGVALPVPGYDSAMPGSLLPLQGHLPGGRALWRSESGAWRGAPLHQDGLFLPGRYGVVEVWYEKQLPLPIVTLKDGRVLRPVRIWGRVTQMAQAMGLEHLVGRSAGLLGILRSVQARALGFPEMAIGSALGLVEMRVEDTHTPSQATGASIIYRSSDGRYARCQDPTGSVALPAQPAATQSAVFVCRGPWIATTQFEPTRFTATVT